MENGAIGLRSSMLKSVVGQASMHIVRERERASERARFVSMRKTWLETQLTKVSAYCIGDC